MQTKRSSRWTPPSLAAIEVETARIEAEERASAPAYEDGGDVVINCGPYRGRMASEMAREMAGLGFLLRSLLPHPRLAPELRERILEIVEAAPTAAP